MLPALLLLGLGACGQSSSRHAAAPARTATPSPTVIHARPKAAFVTFAAGVSYPAAVRAVTDLGLQARTFGASLAYSPPGAAESSQGWWQPEASDRDFPMTSGPDARRGRLYVAPTPLAPADWADRVDSLSGVVKTQVYMTEPSWPLRIVYTAPPADAVQYVAEDQVDTLVRVTVAGAVPYESAIVLVSRLGFRLSNPCYDQAQASGHSPAWQPTGQESSFAATHALLVRVTYVNAASWRQQLTGNPEAYAVEAPAAVACY
ncbi:MAG: hypothetical protein ACRDHE_04715 [Ktedonobacterales bacterium]